MKIVQVITSQLLHRILITAAVVRLNSHGYSGKSVELFTDAVIREVESTGSYVRAKCAQTVANTAKKGGDEEAIFLMAVTVFAEAGIDIADRVIRERVSSN